LRILRIWQPYSGGECRIGAIILPISDPSSFPGAGNVIATPISDFHLTASLVWPHDAQLSRAGEAVSALLIPFIARYIEENNHPAQSQWRLGINGSERGRIAIRYGRLTRQYFSPRGAPSQSEPA